MLVILEYFSLVNCNKVNIFVSKEHSMDLEENGSLILASSMCFLLIYYVWQSAVCSSSPWQVPPTC